ncbi:RNA polymerase sigma factor [Paracoccus denitrificans]|uniref:RNA polymerase sigma factor n=1 Tax=Paracoccus denitrificans TaxID=266 RepID=UPI000CEBDFF5|nr:RNA polymerase sigma factor [Paracoccus denitrificans]
MERTGIDWLFCTHRGDVSSYLARMLRDPDLAEDLTQDAFLRCCTALQSGGRPENLRGYLYRIARNIAVDHLRLQKRRRTDMPGDHVLAAIADPRPGQERWMIDRERLKVFLRALAALPDKTQRIFVLHRIQRLSYREVARHMELSESSVQKHLARALLEVTRRLREYEDG